MKQAAWFCSFFSRVQCATDCSRVADHPLVVRAASLDVPGRDQREFTQRLIPDDVLLQLPSEDLK